MECCKDIYLRGQLLDDVKVFCRETNVCVRVNGELSHWYSCGYGVGLCDVSLAF